jgi:ketol-acid reductoisomerase
MKNVETDIIGGNYNNGKNNGVDNKEIISVNKVLRSHTIEKVGDVLRAAMTDMKVINTVQ